MQGYLTLWLIKYLFFLSYFNDIVLNRDLYLADLELQANGQS